jgi:hypothetical protein
MRPCLEKKKEGRKEEKKQKRKRKRPGSNSPFKGTLLMTR